MKNKINHNLSNGFLNVDDGHELYYETFGNPKGIPVLFLHGGPGLGFTDMDKRFFDPSIFHAIFFDQRGAPRSKPHMDLEHSKTQQIVEDVRKMLDFHKVDKAILFGGSWGSTLSLLFSIQYPSRVGGMVLRGIFPGTRESIDHYTQGGSASFFPEAWERFSSLVPETHKHDIAQYYYNNMCNPNSDISQKYSYEWARYGMNLAKLRITETEIDAALSKPSDYLDSKMEAYYSVHNCFLPDNYIYNNVAKIGNIPVRIVHGRYDMICPAVYAYRLHQKLKNSQLFFVNAGHVSSEPETEEMLISQLHDLLKEI